jgi:tetraacyldisaccharide 4'-kinase
MNFNFYLLKSFRILLFPFAVLYGIGVKLRNWCYDRGFFSSTSFNLPIVCVGNLSVGGTGKSPMTEYLIRLLKDRYEIAVISRGYKRQSQGYILAHPATTALEIGDEPMQFHKKFPNVSIAVGEERIVAVPQLLQDRPKTQCIILDDAFQHRSIIAGLNIVLTEYNNLYTRDFYLPTGDLRDSSSSIKRANIIVVTKCPNDLSQDDREAILYELDVAKHQQVFFTGIDYGIPYHISDPGSEYIITHDTEVLLVCGIANPKPLKQYLTQHAKSFTLQAFNDHHVFDNDDIRQIQTHFANIKTPYKIILTTEKDAVRLHKFYEQLANQPIFAIPMKHVFLFDEAAKFDNAVIGYINEAKA